MLEFVIYSLYTCTLSFIHCTMLDAHMNEKLSESWHVRPSYPNRLSSSTIEIVWGESLLVNTFSTHSCSGRCTRLTNSDAEQMEVASLSALLDQSVGSLVHISLRVTHSGTSSRPVIVEIPHNCELIFVCVVVGSCTGVHSWVEGYICWTIVSTVLSTIDVDGHGE